MALNMDHAQLRLEDPTAALHPSNAILLYKVPWGLPAKLPAK